jgi:hypothetical protein
MHSPLYPQHHHGSRLTSTTPVGVFAGDMLRRLPTLAPPRLRRYKSFHTRTAQIAFTGTDPTNSFHSSARAQNSTPRRLRRVRPHFHLPRRHFEDYNAVHFHRLQYASYGALL